MVLSEPDTDATLYNTGEFHFYSLCGTSLSFILLKRKYEMKLLLQDRALYSLL